jgi:large subunit ribosomal protein L6
MSRIGKKPVVIPTGVEVKMDGSTVVVKGKLGEMRMDLHSAVSVAVEPGQVVLSPASSNSSDWQYVGTTRALLSNMVVGVSQGFSQKLELVGVGYKAQSKGTSVSLAVGYSHPVEFQLPVGITAESPTQTEIVIKGMDKQVVGQVAANIRRVRPPEPYKGKGIRYAGEAVRRKEAKKK